MSSELSIHINGEPMKGEVTHFPSFATARIRVGKDIVTLYAWTNEQERLAQVFRELADGFGPTDCPHCHTECPCFREGYEAERRP